MTQMLSLPPARLSMDGQKQDSCHQRKIDKRFQFPNDLVYDREHDLFEWPELDLDLTSDSHTVAPEEPHGMNDDRFKPEEGRI